MKLFLKPGACSLSPHIVLEEAGLSYETEVVDLAKKVTASGADFLAINPKGYVPALQLDSGEVLTEGVAATSEQAVREYSSVLDKAVKRGIIKKNTAIRRKKRATAALRKLAK